MRTRRPQADDLHGPRRIKINIPGFGTLAGTYTHDWSNGATAYTLTGPRVRGTFTVTHDPRRLVHDPGARHDEKSYYETLDPDTAHLSITYGAGDHWHGSERTDRPQVNGIDLCGGTGVNTDVMRARRLNRHDVNVRRGRWEHASVPDATADRTATVLHGIAAHWLTRPECYALRLAACRRYAARHPYDAARDTEAARRRLERARLELERAEAYGAELEAAGTIPPAAPPAAADPAA